MVGTAVPSKWWMPQQEMPLPIGQLVAAILQVAHFMFATVATLTSYGLVAVMLTKLLTRFTMPMKT